jgi:hypothetical protein
MKILESARMNTPFEDKFESDEKRYEWQMAVRANYLLLGDTNVKLPIEVHKNPMPIIDTPLRWINRGELVAGSFMCNYTANAEIPNKDIDIYFKCKADVETFMGANRVWSMTHNDIANIVLYGGVMYNLIHGVHYDDPEDLISHFDIRACSIALDPCTNTVYNVEGALSDCARKRIIFNPVPHNTTIARLVKYAQKGFDIDPYQRLFFAELIRSEKYNYDLEISTGYRAVVK